MDKTEKQAQLEDRLIDFASRIVRLVRSLPKTVENRIYGHQLIKSSSSEGANYAEATCAHTKKDFTHDMNRVRKEAKESVFWLKLLYKVNSLSYRSRIKKELNEAEELFKIFNSAVRTSRKGI